MHDVPIPHELAYDPQELLSPGYGRDPERTPMQWDASANAGFSTATPWLPIADDYVTNNMEAQRDDPSSMLSLFRRLIELRSGSAALTIGAQRSLDAGSDDVIAYLRETPEQRMLVVLNLGSSALTLD